MKAIKHAELRDITDSWNKEDITFSKMVELLNNKADEFAIEYAEWMVNYSADKDNYIKIPSTKELLEIYKKEKQL